MTEYWFKPRRYGAGANPVTWQGWATIVAFPVVAAVVLLAIFAVTPPIVAFTLYAILIPAAMVAFFSFLNKKTDGDWRFRWGGDKSDKI
jgi:hypothetical protein